MDRDILLLSLALGILSLGVLVLGADILAGSRRRAALAAAPQDELRAFLRAAPPMQAPPALPEPAIPAPVAFEPPPAPTASEPAPAPAADGFVFRRHVSRDFASMEMSHKRFRTAPGIETPPPAPLDFSTIQSEVRAILGAATPVLPSSTAQAAHLIWTEPERLAVLSLAGATPETGLALLRAHGIATLIAAPGHPFRPPIEGVELLALPDGADAAAPLAAQLRAKLAEGERIAFHTETGLSGAAALLAARFSSRRAG